MMKLFTDSISHPSLSTRNLLLLTSLCALSIASFAATARADDFFDREEVESDTETTDTGSGFTILNAFRPDGTPTENGTPEPPKRAQWGNFEDVSGQEPEKKFLKSGEVRLWRELRKPLPERQPFGNRLDSLEDSVDSLKAPNVRNTLSK